MHGYSTCIIVPVRGRLWLPPDCEEASVLFGKLCTHFDRESKAEHRGEDHVAKNRDLRNKAQVAAVAIIEIHKSLYHAH